jgi:glucokinase
VSVPDALAIDIGGTKLAVARVDEQGRARGRRTVPTPAAGSAAGMFEALWALVDAVLEDGPVRVCGVGCGGPMTPGGELVSPLNIPAWRDAPLRSTLAERLGVPVFVDNDAKALALGEGWCGAAAGCRDYLAMVVSTGLGGATVLDGRLLDGAAGNAGHVGHVVVVPDGAPCACGSQGCLEAEISGPSIARRTGRPPAEADEAERLRAGTLLGRGIAAVAVLLDLKLAVVAGSVALGYGDPFLSAAQAELDRTCRIAYARGTEVRRAGLGDLGPVVGAAAVGWRGIGELGGAGGLGGMART